MAKDSFPGNVNALSAQAHRWAVVTPNDGADLPLGVPKAIHIGGGSGDPGEGSIVCTDGDGNTATFFGRQGDFLPIRPHRIRATGTTANLVIIACY
jgi:hypothetical protein